MEAFVVILVVVGLVLWFVFAFLLNKDDGSF